MNEVRTFETGVSDEEYDGITGSPFIIIPAGESGIEKEGDSVYLIVEAGIAEQKKPGVSLQIPLTVVESGINYGKVYEFWYPGIKDAAAMGILKQGLKAFGIEDKVIIKKDGKTHINPMGFAGARARAKFVRERSNLGNLRSVLSSTDFQPADAFPKEAETEG